MKLYIIYSTFMCVLNTYYGQHIVEHCPLDIVSWNKRSIVLDCAKGLEYHCILTYNATLFEVCIERKIYEADRKGCPWIQFHNNEPLFGAKNTNCPDDLKGCPPNEHRGYGSDQLYLYPKCLVPEKDRIQNRSMVATKCITYEHVTQTAKLDDRDSNFVEIFLIVLMSGISLVLLTVIMCLIRRIVHAKKEGDPEQRPVELKQLREKCVSGSQYNYVWRCGVQNVVEHKAENGESFYSDTRIITFKCMDKFNLQNEIELFKENNNTNEVYEDSESASLIAETSVGKDGLRRTRARFETIAVFLNVTTSTADLVREFTRFLIQHCCANDCIAYSNDKDVFLNTKETLYKREPTINDIHDDLDELQRDEDEYAMVDDVSELTNYNPIVRHNTNYCKITHQTVSVPDESFLCNSFPSFSLRERILLGIFMFIVPRNVPICIFQRYFDLDLNPEMIDSFVRKCSELTIESERGSGNVRYLKIPEEIPKRLRDTTDQKEQSLILVSLFHTLNCLFLKDQADPSDKQRCKEILQHAIETMKYTDTVLKAPSMEKAISVIMVCEGIAHTCANMQDLQNEIEYKRRAIDLYNKHILRGKFEQTFTLTADSTLPKRLWYREAAAGIIRRIECSLREDISDTISLFVKKYSIQRCRTSSNTKAICKILGKDYLDQNDHLSKEEIDLLSTKGFVGSEKDVGRNFLIELLISLYYGYGCLAFHDLNATDAQSYIDYIQISYHMSKILGKFLPCHTPLCKILTDVFGRMEISLRTYEMYNKGRSLSPNEREELIKFDRRLSERMNEKCKFFEYGVFVYDNESPSHKDSCQRQRSRCRNLLSEDNSSYLPINTLVPHGDGNHNLHRKID